MIFDKHVNLIYKFENHNFGFAEYYASAVGLNEQTIMNRKKMIYHLVN